MKHLILIKYGELTTKKANRKAFINMLAKNIERLLNVKTAKIHQDRVRMYIEVEECDLDETIHTLKKVFGVHSIVVCYPVQTNTEDIKEKSLELLKRKDFHTFKVKTKRADKNFPISSMDFNSVIGGHILKNMDCKVDVHHPDIILQIEIRGKQTYLYTEEISGSGGYPVGIQGKGMLMLSGGIDSPVAGYMALKRGVDMECLYFESPPHTSIQAKNKVFSLAHILNQYSGRISVHVVPFTKIQEEIYKNVPDNYIITIMRRMMYRIAEQYGRKRKCKIIINGESIGQVASQTLSSMVVINEVANIPVIRPVACLDKLEIIALAKKIGTYDTSILPYEDCCTIFLPKHPVIHPDLRKAKEYETSFNYKELIEECIEHIEVVTKFETTKNQDLL